MHDIERDDRLGEALEGERADFFERCHVFDLNGDPLGNQDLPIPGLGTKAGGDIAYSTDRGVAGAPNGQATNAPPSKMMNSRRLIASPSDENRQPLAG